jgi:putative Holliday junction resolvase
VRILGVDHGSRRIGVAIGDTETGMAFARPAILLGRGEDGSEAIGRLARAEEIRLTIVGLPLNMDGSEGRQAAAARAFGERLAGIGLEVVYHDERLTSWQAGGELQAAGRRPERSSGELDSTAARTFLQEYLDANRRPAAADFREEG